MCGHGDGGEGGGSSAGEKISGDKNSDITDFIQKKKLHIRKSPWPGRGGFAPLAKVQSAPQVGQHRADLPPLWPR